MYKVPKPVLYNLVILICLFLILSLACSNSDFDREDGVTFEKLLSNPSQYNRQEIAVQGYIYLGFETMVLSEKLKGSGYAEGHLIPNGSIFWIEGGIPTEIYDELYEQDMMGISERYGKVLVTGIFQYGGQYGHMGMYEYQISLLRIEPIS